MTLKTIHGYIDLKDVNEEHEGIKAVVWESPWYDERIPCTLIFDVPAVTDEPNIAAVLEERSRPTYREEAKMEHGVEIREAQG